MVFQKDFLVYRFVFILKFPLLSAHGAVYRLKVFFKQVVFVAARLLSTAS